MARIHQPPDALAAPRFTGPRTFARLPRVAAGQHFRVIDVEGSTHERPRTAQALAVTVNGGDGSSDRQSSRSRSRSSSASPVT
jgi:hypothetical protein